MSVYYSFGPRVSGARAGRTSDQMCQPRKQWLSDSQRGKESLKEWREDFCEKEFLFTASSSGLAQLCWKVETSGNPCYLEHFFPLLDTARLNYLLIITMHDETFQPFGCYQHVETFRAAILETNGGNKYVTIRLNVFWSSTLRRLSF